MNDRCFKNPAWFLVPGSVFMNNNLELITSITKKKFLFVSYDALISDVAWQVAKEGHDVKYYIKNPSDKDSADG